MSDHLTDLDRQVLDARAIAPTVRDDRGYRTVTAKEAAAYGFVGDQARDGLLIPCHNTQGLNGAYQLRPHDPRRNDQGKQIKYEWPAGKKLTVDVPLAAQPLLDNIEIPLLITESPIKADAIMSAAEPGTVAAIAVIGVWGWRSNGAPLSDFRDIPLCTKQGDRIKTRRRVLILFDSDTATNPKVAYARQDLTEFLDRRGGAIDQVDIPAGPDGEKQGIDDALANGYTLAGLLATAHRPRPIDPALTADDPDRQRIAELERENAELRTKATQTRQILADKRLSAQERICAIVFKEEVERIQQHGEHDLGLGPVRGTIRAVDATGALALNRPHAATRCGTTPKTWDNFVKIPVSLGLIERAGQTRIRVGERVNRRGEIVPTYESTARLRPRGDMGTFLTDLLERLPDPTPRAKPGPKNFCAEHPTADVIRRTTYTCSVCDVAVAPLREVWVDAGTPPDVEPERPDNGWYERAVNDHHPETARMERQPELAFQEVPSVTPETAPSSVVASSPHVAIETPPVTPEIPLTRAQEALTVVDHAQPADRHARMELAERLTDVAHSRSRKPDPKPARTIKPLPPPTDQGVPF